MQLLPDFDNEPVIAPEVLVDEGGKEVRSAEIVLVVEVEETAGLRGDAARVLGEVFLVTNGVAPLLGQES